MNNQFNDNAKEQIRLRADIGAVIGRYVNLKGRGHTLSGLCPFHKEKSPSFTVNTAKGVFHCFGCGKGGDVFRFIQEIEGVDFREALEMLAEETGVKIENRRGSWDDGAEWAGSSSPPPWALSSPDTSFASNNNTAAAKPAPKTELLAIHNDAAEYYYQQMKNNRQVIDYFKSRGLAGETVKEFRLGYAPAEWSGLCDYLQGRGIPMSRIIECGLAVRKEDSGATYDRFRDRVIFPLYDLAGRIVAFAGRGMSADITPKYLNSPETALYRKSQILYGLHKAKQDIRERGFLLIVEGYMDCLALYQEGIRNAAAVSGTAFTEEHAHLIKRFARKVTLVFDGDRAGQAAAQKAAFVLAPSGLQVSILTLPQGDDPDSFVRRDGGDAFLKLLKTAKAAEDFLIDRLVSESDGSPHGKGRIIDELAPYAHALSDAIVRSDFLSKLAARLRVDAKLISERLAKKDYSQSSINNSQVTREERFDKRAVLGKLEESFLRILITSPELIIQAKQYISPEILTDSLSANIYSIILEAYAQNGGLGGLLDLCGGDPEIERAVSMLAVTPALTENIQDELVQKILRLRQKFLKAQMSGLKDELSRCPDERKAELLELIRDYGTQLNELGSQV